MSLTPNYSFIIPTGSDAVNLLTQCYPNFTSLDSILKPIQESGVTVATDTKVGTVHQLVRTDSSCNMFRFIATGNYASGDTFTVDGASVTATAMDGTALSAGAFVINQSVVCILNNLVLTVLVSGKETTSLPASSITYDNTGSGLTATNAQDAIDEVYNAIPVIPPVVEHGVYELWVNPNIGSSYAAAQVVISDLDVSTYDSFIIVVEPNMNEASGALWYEFETSVITGNSHKLSMLEMGASGVLYQFQRNVTTTKTSTSLTLDFTDGQLIERAINNTVTTSTNNNYCIPVRVLGLKHNS